MVNYGYFLSERDARDISLARTEIGRSKLDLPCPEGLRMLMAVMNHLSPEVSALMGHPHACTNKAPAPIKAYSILCRAAAKIAREYWIAQQAHMDAIRAAKLAEVAAVAA